MPTQYCIFEAQKKRNSINGPILNLNNGVDVGRTDIALKEASFLISDGIENLPKIAPLCIRHVSTSKCVLDASLKEDLKAKCAVVCSSFEEAIRLDLVKIKELLPIFQPIDVLKRDQLREQDFTHELRSIERVAILMTAFAVAYL